jgi:uncharacterized membrane protein
MLRWLLDLVFAALLTLLAGAAIVTLDGLLRVALVLPVILFVPGYAFLSMLFPEGSRLSRSRDNRRTWGRQERTDRREESGDSFLLSDLERLGLSLALSLAIVSLIVFGLNFTVGFGTRRITAMLLGLTGAMIIFAIARRVVLPPEERYVFEFSLNGFPTDTSFVGMFAVSLLVLTASVGLFAAQSPASQQFTQFTAVDKNDSTGNMSISAVDDAVLTGEPFKLIIKNNETDKTTYTVVVTLETVENGKVTNMEEVDRFTTTVDAGATKRIKYDEAPSDGGDRVSFYIYKGNVPEKPSRESAYLPPMRVYLSTDGEDNQDEQEAIAPPSLFRQQPQPAGSR